MQINFANDLNQTIQEINVITIQNDYQNPIEPTTAMTFSQFGITHYIVEYWDGSMWQTIPNGVVAGNYYVWRQFTFTPIVTNKIRVTVTSAADGHSRIIEVEAWTGNSV